MRTRATLRTAHSIPDRPNLSIQLPPLRSAALLIRLVFYAAVAILRSCTRQLNLRFEFTLLF